MTTAAQIISTTLRTHLNALAPGQSADTDTSALCLDALNNIIDGLNLQPSPLQREVLTLSGTTPTGSTLVYGTDWTGITPGTSPLGLNCIDAAGIEWPLEPITMQELQKGFGSEETEPRYYAFDGYSTIHLRGASVGHSFRIRYRENMTEFADTTTQYTLANGFRKGLGYLLAESVGETLVGAIPPIVREEARKFRQALNARGTRPDILNVRRPKFQAPSQASSGGAAPGFDPELVTITYETFLIDFEEFAQYDSISTDPLNPTTVLAVGDQGTNLNLAAVIKHTSGGTPFGQIVQGSDLLSTYPGLVNCLLLTSFTANPYIEFAIPMDSSVIDESYVDEFGDPFSVQFFSAFGLYWSGNFDVQLESTRVGAQVTRVFNKLSGWASSTGAEYEPGRATNNYEEQDYELMRVMVAGAVPDGATDRISFVLGTRHPNQ